MGEFNLGEYARDNLQELKKEIPLATDEKTGKVTAGFDVRFISKTITEKALRKVNSIKGSDAARLLARRKSIYNIYASAVTHWWGMTPEVVASLLPVNSQELAKVMEEAGCDELPFNTENVVAMLRHSQEFHGLVASSVEDLQFFRQEGEADRAGK